MRELILTVALIAAVFFALEGVRGEAGPGRRREVFVISLQKRRDFESREAWYLQYALDGRIEQAVFYAPAGAHDYMRYLESLGKK
jgi:hypothetical protein